MISIETTSTKGRFRFFPQLNDQDYTDWMHSTDRMTEKTTDLHFQSDTLQDKLLRAMAKERMIPIKEVLESFEFFSRIRKTVRSEFVVDLFCGHGLLGMLFAIFEPNVERVLLIDRKQPDSQARLIKIISEVAPWAIEKIETRKAEISADDDWITDGCTIVSSHACGVLTDMCIEIAIKSEGAIGLLPCCYPRRGCRAPQAVQKAVGMTMAYDIDRTYRLEQAGYLVRWTEIPKDITPMNRVLIGKRKEQ